MKEKSDGRNEKESQITYLVEINVY
jgi:hypothetical protein